jgi:transcription elongation factor GreA
MDLDLKKEIRYTLVAPEEAEFGADRISVFSPIGKGLLTHAPGDEVSIQVPAGIKRFKVLSLKR